MRFNKNSETLVPIAAFDGGLNESLDTSLIPINQSDNTRNVNIDNGVFEVRNGQKLFATISGIMDKNFIVNPYFRNGRNYLIISTRDSGYLYEYDIEKQITKEIGSKFKSGNWVGVNFNSNNKDIIILTNGEDPTKVWDGTTLRDLKQKGASSSNSISNRAPQGYFIDVHYERVWIADTQNLYASSVTRDGFDIDDWTTPTDPTEVNQHGVHIFAYSNDGGSIRGMKVLFGDIVVFKDKSIFKIFGSNPGNYQKVDITGIGIGSIAQNSIVATPQGAFFANGYGIYLFDGSNLHYISEPIKKTWNNIGNNYLEGSKAVYWDNKYIIAISGAKIGPNNEDDIVIEYNLSNKTFNIKNGIEVRGFFKLGNSLMIVQRGQILEYDTNDIKKQNITAYWNTPITTFGYPNAMKEISTVYLTASTDSENNKIRVECKTEKNTKFKIVNLMQGEHVYRVNINNMGRVVNFKFNNYDNSRFKLKEVKALIEIDED